MKRCSVIFLILFFLAVSYSSMSIAFVPELTHHFVRSEGSHDNKTLVASDKTESFLSFFNERPFFIYQYDRDHHNGFLSIRTDRKTYTRTTFFISFTPSETSSFSDKLNQFCTYGFITDITVFRNSDMDDITYHYDANGNLKQRITTAGIEEIIYNPRNQPIAIIKGGEKVASFTYDSIGMRNRSLDLETGKQQDYLREGRKVLAEMDGKGANRKVYRYGNGPMGYVANGLPQFTSRDPVGSPFAVSSSTGKLLETRQYEPFGASTATMDSVDDYPNVHIHYTDSSVQSMQRVGDLVTNGPEIESNITADLPLAGAVGETYEPELFLTIGDNPETTHLPVHQVPLILVTDLPPPYVTLEANTLVFGPTTTDPVTYTLTIEPVGNTFSDVIITIPLPNTVEYNNTSGQQPNHDPITNILTWNYTQFSGLQTIEFTITVDFIKNYDTWLDLQATLTATELFDTNRLSNTASTAVFNNGLVALITPKADFDPAFIDKPTAYALLDPDPLATSQSITCDYTIKLLGETSQNTQTFASKETESHTNLMYFGARFYDPVIGRFISEDPYNGDVNKPNSLARYSYGFNNPLIFVDPFGYATEAQFAEALTAALYKYTKFGNKTAMGTTGEIVLERLLQQSGQIIVKGPVTTGGQHNADIITYDPSTKKFNFIDNKIQTVKKTVSRAKNLKYEFMRNRSIDVAYENIQKLNISNAEKLKLLDELDEIKLNHFRANWLVADASPLQVKNVVKGISTRLASKGIRYATIVDNELKIRNLEESIEGVRGSKKFLRKIGKYAPAALTIGLTAFFTSERIQAAETEDAIHREIMASMGLTSQHPVQSTIRETVVIVGEETGGEILAWGFGALGTTVSGPLSLIVTPLAAGVGGVAGSWSGGKYAAWQFDKVNQVSEIELQSIMDELDKQFKE